MTIEIDEEAFIGAATSFLRAFADEINSVDLVDDDEIEYRAEKFALALLQTLMHPFAPTRKDAAQAVLSSIPSEDEINSLPPDVANSIRATIQMAKKEVA